MLCLVALAAAGLLGVPSIGRALQLGSPDYRLSGFGTLGEVHSNSDEADFTSSFYAPNGAGYTHDWSPSVDSLAGLQFNGQFLPKLSGVVQLLVEQQYDNHWWPSIEWANLQYEVTPALSIRAGRIVLPTFMDAETRDVGYATAWVRPPPELYQMVPTTHNDGVDLSYRMNLGDVTNTLQGMFGWNVEHSPGGLAGDAHSNDLWGISDNAEYAHLTLHLAYEALRMSLSGTDAIFAPLRQFSVQGNYIANLYDADAKPYIVKTIGLDYDPGHWFVMGEWAQVRTGFFQGINSAWYATAGYRASQLTPYASFATRKADTPAGVGLSLAGLSAGQAAQAEGLNALLAGLLAPRNQQTVSIGLRWDCYQNLDLKLQYDAVRLAAHSSGLLINLLPGFRPGSTYDLISADLDYLF
jgi:hypothetical protein